MFGRALVDKHVVAWQFEHFAYLIDMLSALPGLADSELWLPIPEHFPEAPDKSQLPGHLFACVMHQMGFPDDTPFELIGESPDRPESLGGVAMVQPAEPAPAGTYQAVGDETEKQTAREIIRFDLSLGPGDLVTTFAHELSHAAQQRVIQWPDIDMELYELFTDLTAVYFGYGVFLANSRFSFSGYSDGTTQGWQARGAGYLPEADLIFATVLFMAIRDLPASAALPYLKPRLHKSLKRAFRQLERYQDDVEALRDRVPPTNSGRVAHSAASNSASP
jgi:hypothetical protein